MTPFNQEDRTKINKILESLECRLDQNLIRLIMDLILKTNWTKNVTINLYKNNKNNIPDKSLDAFILGGNFGQIYQISLDLAKKLQPSLSSNQKIF